MSHYLVSALNICKENVPPTTPCLLLTFSTSATIIFIVSDLFLPFFDVNKIRESPFLFLLSYTFEKWDHNYSAKPFMQLQVVFLGTSKELLTKKKSQMLYKNQNVHYEWN